LLILMRFMMRFYDCTMFIGLIFVCEWCWPSPFILHLVVLFILMCFVMRFWDWKMFIGLIFVFECIWANPLILHIVSFHVLGHFIIIIVACMRHYDDHPFDSELSWWCGWKWQGILVFYKQNMGIGVAT
jgi:hypothetical protein